MVDSGSGGGGGYGSITGAGAGHLHAGILGYLTSCLGVEAPETHSCGTLGVGVVTKYEP